MPKANDVRAYIAAASPKARPMLRQLRAAVRAAAPTAKESLSYGMPYYSYKGRLVYFAAFKNHVGFYISGGVLKAHEKAVKKYRTSHATLQFPLGARIPLTVVKKIVKARVRANEMAAKVRGGRKGARATAG